MSAAKQVPGDNCVLPFFDLLYCQRVASGQQYGQLWSAPGLCIGSSDLKLFCVEALCCIGPPLSWLNGANPPFAPEWPPFAPPPLPPAPIQPEFKKASSDCCCIAASYSRAASFAALCGTANILIDKHGGW